MAERYPEAELVLDDELVYDESPRRSAFLRREDRPEDIVREGEVLAGKYRVERIPGRNGLGVLVQVRHMELGQEVTLKFLVPEACAYPEFVQRFVREARAAVKIQGEHVARVTDVGRLESGAPYMVREFLRGPDLAEVVKVRGPLPFAEAVDYIIQACEGVAEGHALGVVHRNLRPTSLVVARRSDGMPLVKVFDFAASESLHVNPFTERAVSLVGTSAIMASLPYLAPEQIRDPHDVDFRADVYSLGAVLFELLTGTPVYTAEAAPALLAQVAADPAPAVRTLRPDVPGELDHIVLRCLAKNRAIRYPSIADLALALRQFASDEIATSVDRIVRLGKRTSKLPELAEGRIASPPPTPPIASVMPLSQATPARGRHATIPLHAAEPGSAQSLHARRSSAHDDVTTINPYTSYAAPVVIHPESSRTAEPPRSEPTRHTPQPPPLRSSGPPPLRTPVPPPISAPAPLSAPHQRAQINTVPFPNPLPAPAYLTSTTERPELRPGPTSAPPPPRSSISGGLTRSWAVPEEAPQPFFTQRRLAIAAIAACATLGAVLATRSRAPVAAAASAPVAAPVVAAPVKVEQPAAPPAALPVAAPSAAAVASAPSTTALAAPPAAAPVAATPPAAAPVAATPPARAPAPVAAAVRPAAPIVAAAAAPRAVAARRPISREDAPADTARKPAVTAAMEQKVASSRPASGGTLFDDPN